MQVRHVLRNQDRQVFGHLARFHRLDAYLLERAGERRDLGRAIELAAMRKAARPGEDAGDLESNTISRTGMVLTAAIRVALVPPLQYAKGDLKSSRIIGMYDYATQTVVTKESRYDLDDAGRKEGMHREVKLPGFGPVSKCSVPGVALTYLCAATP